MFVRAATRLRQGWVPDHLLQSPDVRHQHQAVHGLFS